MKTINKVLVVIGIVALIALVGFYIFLEVCLSPGMKPLRFILLNNGGSTHEVTVEICDFSNKTIFIKTYILRPGEIIQSPGITEKRGEYMFKVTVDKNTTKLHKAYVREGNFGVMVTIYSSTGFDIHTLSGD